MKWTPELAAQLLPRRYPSRDPLAWRHEQDERGYRDGERGLKAAARNRYYLAGHSRGMRDHRRGMNAAGGRR